MWEFVLLLFWFWVLWRHIRFGSQLGWTPLIFSAEAGQVDSVRLLLDAGANLEAVDMVCRSFVDFDVDCTFCINALPVLRSMLSCCRIRHSLAWIMYYIHTTSTSIPRNCFLLYVLAF